MWLIGMMGSGKTTAGRRLASEVGVPFFDTDDIVVEMARMPITAIWDSVGEDGFRQLEREAVSTVPERQTVAAAGGGAVLLAENRERMTRGAPVVWLRCAPDLLARRLETAGNRPLLEGDLPIVGRLSTLLDDRGTTYADVATDVLDTDDLTIDAVVAQLLEIWQR